MSNTFVLLFARNGFDSAQRVCHAIQTITCKTEKSMPAGRPKGSKNKPKPIGFDNPQIKAIDEFLGWLKTCPHMHTISSMQGGYFHVKFLVGGTDPRPIAPNKD